MLHFVLQAWGGLFYLLNKICFSRAERANEERTKQVWRIWSWTVYLIGMPAWVAIFVMNRNWMVAAVELGGTAAMVLGLVIALRGVGQEPPWLDWVARGAAILGLGYSLYDFGGITTPNQVLELGINAGFLVGTYLLARQRPTGYLWFMLMNGSNAALQYIQGYPWLVVQQIVSIGFVVDAFLMQKRKARIAFISSPAPSK